MRQYQSRRLRHSREDGNPGHCIQITAPLSAGGMDSCLRRNDCGAEFSAKTTRLSGYQLSGGYLDCYPQNNEAFRAGALDSCFRRDTGRSPEGRDFRHSRENGNLWQHVQDRAGLLAGTLDSCFRRPLINFRSLTYQCHSERSEESKAVYWMGQNFECSGFGFFTSLRSVQNDSWSALLKMEAEVCTAFPSQQLSCPRCLYPLQAFAGGQ